MMRLRLVAGTPSKASSSPHTIWRLPVFSSSSRSGWLLALYCARLLSGTIFERSKSACVLRLGTWTMIGWPGEKPSLRFHSRGSVRLPSLFLGIAAAAKFTRRPVGVVLSALVCAKSLGNGSRQDFFGTPLQVAAGAAAGSARSAKPARTTTSRRKRVVIQLPFPKEIFGTDTVPLGG